MLSICLYGLRQKIHLLMVKETQRCFRYIHSYNSIKSHHSSRFPSGCVSMRNLFVLCGSILSFFCSKRSSERKHHKFAFLHLRCNCENQNLNAAYVNVLMRKLYFLCIFVFVCDFFLFYSEEKNTSKLFQKFKMFESWLLFLLIETKTKCEC